MTRLRRTAAAALLAASTTALLLPSAAVADAPDGTPDRVAAACTKLSTDDLDGELLRTYAGNADDVFVGEVGGVSSTSLVGARSTDYVHDVRVEKVYEGDLHSGDAVNLLTTSKHREDGLGRLDVPGTYLFFTTDVEPGNLKHLPKGARKAANRPTVSAVDCAGTTELPDGLGARLRDQIESLLAPEPSEPVQPVLSDPADGAAEPPSLGRSVAPGAALVLVGVLGLVLFSRLGRRRA